MIDLENKEERNKLIDDFFNKGLECNIKEVYQAVVNTIADLEYANDEKIKEIERLKKENAILKQTMCDESLLINENALLKDIIKEVRKYIENTKMFTNGDEKEFTLKETWYGKELLEILDKESK